MKFVKSAICDSFSGDCSSLEKNFKNLSTKLQEVEPERNVLLNSKVTPKLPPTWAGEMSSEDVAKIWAGAWNMGALIHF